MPGLGTRGGPFPIALTGHGQQRDRDAVFDAGFDQHLVKPVDTDVLMQLLGGASPEK